MKLLKALLLLGGMSAVAFGGPAGPPGGAPILNQNFLQPGATFYVPNGIVSNSLRLLYLVPGLCTTTDANGKIINVVCGGSGGASRLGVNWNGVQVTSPTVALNGISPIIITAVSGGTTAQFSLDPTSVTLQGQNVIKLTSTLQPGATLYVSSGTIINLLSQNLVANLATFPNGLTANGLIQGNAQLQMFGQSTFFGPVVSANFGYQLPDGSVMASTTNFAWNGSAPQNATINIASATVRTQLNLPYLTPGACLTTDAAGHIITVVCGATPPVAISTGGVIVSSPTPQMDFNGFQFLASLSGTTTQLQLNPSSVTLQGNAISLAALSSSMTAVGISTGALSASTTTLQGEITTNTASIASLGVSTGSLQTEVNGKGVGTITGVTAGTALTGGGLSGNVTVNVDNTKVIMSQNTLQSGATFYVSSGTVTTLSAGSIALQNVVSGTQCLHADSSGNVTGTGTDCGLGGGGGASTLETLFGTARSSPTATVRAPAPFTGSVTGSTMTLGVDYSSFTMLGPNVVKSQQTLQIGTTIYIASGTIAGNLIVSPTVSSTTAVCVNYMGLPGATNQCVESGTEASGAYGLYSHISGIAGVGTPNSQDAIAIVGRSEASTTGNGWSIGVEGVADQSTYNNYGVWGIANATAGGVNYGLYGQANASGKTNRGIHAEAEGFNGTNIGGDFDAANNAASGTNTAIKAVAGNSATDIGLDVSASGGTNEFGIFVRAGQVQINSSATITGAGGAGVTYGLSAGTLTVKNVASGTQCLHADPNGLVTGTGADCGSGGGGGSTLETLFGTARSSPTNTLRGSSDFSGSVTGSTMTLSLAAVNAGINTFTSSETFTAAGGIGATYGAILGSATVNNLTSGVVQANSSHNLYADKVSLSTSVVGVLPPGNMSTVSLSTGVSGVLPPGNMSAVSLSTGVSGVLPPGSMSIVSLSTGVSGVLPPGNMSTVSLSTGVSGVLAPGNIATISISTGVSGTLQAAQFPALTGDITTTAGSLATTAAATQSNIKTITSSLTVTGAGGLKNSFGIVTSTIQVSSNSILGATTFYADGTAVIGVPGTGLAIFPEGSQPSGVASSDVFWADSSSHTFKVNPNNIGPYTLATTSTTLIPGHCAQWSSTTGAMVDAGAGCGSGGGGTAAGPINAIQYNNPLGTFAGSNNFQVNGTSMTIVSSTSFTSNGLQNSVGGYGFLDVYHGSANTGQLLFSVGSQSQNNQFYIPNAQPAFMGVYGGQIGGLRVGFAATPQQIVSQSRNNYWEANNLSTMTWNTDNDISGGDMIFKPQNAEAFRISALNGISAVTPKGLSVTYGATAGSMTVSNLTSGKCVQAGTGGLLTVSTGACGGGDAVLASTQAWGGMNIYNSTNPFVINGLSASLPLQLDANKNMIATAVDLSGSQATGALAAGRFPALTGDVTTTAGSLATTAAAVQGNIKVFSGNITVASTFTVTTASIAINGVANAYPSAACSSGQMLQSNGGTPQVWTCVTPSAGGAASTLAVATGSANGFSTPVSSPTAAINFSSNTFTGALKGGSTYFATLNAMTGDITTPADSFTTTAAAVQANVRVFSGPITHTSSTTFTGGIAISSGIIISTPTAVITSTFTLTSSMSVVLASCVATGTTNKWITLTLPSAATNPGFDTTIYDVGADSCSVRVQGAGTDLIESSGTVILNAKFQHASLHSLGSVGWAAGFGGIQYTPYAISSVPMDNASYLTGISSIVVQCPIYVPAPVSVLGFRVDKSAGAGNASFGIFDTAGNFMAGLSTQTLSSGVANYLLSSVYQLPPGWYKAAVQLSNTGINLTGANSLADVTSLCSQGAAPSNLDLSKVTLATGGNRNISAFHMDLVINGGQLAN